MIKEIGDLHFSFQNRKKLVTWAGEPLAEEITSPVVCCSFDVTRESKGDVRKTAGNSKQMESSILSA